MPGVVGGQEMESPTSCYQTETKCDVHVQWLGFMFPIVIHKFSDAIVFSNNWVIFHFLVCLSSSKK